MSGAPTRTHAARRRAGWPLAILLLACDDGDPAALALAPWPRELPALIAACDRETFPELATTCRVQAAALAAASGDSAAADALCAAVPPGTWQEECHFRAGEELGRAGQTLSALRHCRAAGWFGRNCLTHTAWRLPADPALRPSADPETLRAAAEELRSGVEAALAGAGDGLEGEGRDLVLARFGYNLYVGRGETDPDPAHLDDPLGAVLRTGFAIEVVRIRPGTLPAEVLTIWQRAAPAPTGPALPAGAPFGRYATPILSPGERGLPHVPLYGGGVRLVGETVEEDVIIAALEALFWDPAQGGAVFLSALDDPRPRVRWTAMRLLRAAGLPGGEPEERALFTELRDRSPDPELRWHAAEALAHPRAAGGSPGGVPGAVQPAGQDPIGGEALREPRPL